MVVNRWVDPLHPCERVPERVAGAGMVRGHRWFAATGRAARDIGLGDRVCGPGEVVEGVGAAGGGPPVGTAMVAAR